MALVCQVWVECLRWAEQAQVCQEWVECHRWVELEECRQWVELEVCLRWAELGLGLEVCLLVCRLAWSKWLSR